MTIRCLVAGFNYAGTGMDLPDCILDAELKRDLFTAVLPQGTEIIFQTDRGKSEYRNDLLELAESVGVEDVGIVYDSGHGSHVRGPEADTWNECIITMPKPGEVGIQIIDDELNRIFSKAQGPLFYLSDRCYSGGLDRAITPEMFARDLYYGNERLPRYYPLDVVEPGERLSFDTGIGASWGLLSAAAREGEYSYSTGRGGAWSLAWNAVWKPGMTHRQIQKAIVPTLLPTAQYPQHPKLIGPKALRDHVALV